MNWINVNEQMPELPFSKKDMRGNEYQESLPVLTVTDYGPKVCTLQRWGCMAEAPVGQYRWLCAGVVHFEFVAVKMWTPIILPNAMMSDAPQSPTRDDASRTS